jgi:hypothetical protein
VTTTVDLASAAGQLLDDERAVMQSHEKKILDAVKAQWTGWVYAGRPDTAPRLVSYDAWRTTLQTTKPPYTLTLFNTATTKKGELYAGYVHRAGTTTLEASQVVQPMIEQKYWPALVLDLDRAIKANIGKPRRLRRVRVGSQGAAMKSTGGIVL